MGTLLKIDHATLNLYQGLYTRVLIDIDISKKLPKHVLAFLKMKKIRDMLVFIAISYEYLPKFYGGCRVLGHRDEECNKRLAGGAKFGDIRNTDMIRRM